MKKVALGPQRDIPSWNWVGFDTGRELSKYFEVSSFPSFNKFPRGVDCILIIKQQAPIEFIQEAKDRKIKIIYCPIDWYADTKHIEREKKLLKMYDSVVLHCEWLSNYLTPHCRKTFFVEHNNRYALPTVAPYRDFGHVLWVGGCQYVSYLCHWLRTHPIKYPLKILTDIDNTRAVNAANGLFHELNLNIQIKENATSIDGYECFRWSERLQHDLMMNECKAAIDIKGQDFNQTNKPPTKAQKYIASGIPFAINSGNYVCDYFSKRGFQIVSPLNQDKWFSESYWEDTALFAEKLRKWTSIETVGLSYKKIIETT